MRVEKHYGRFILCGGIIPHDMVKPGQMWQGSGDFVVTIESGGEWVEYSWIDNGKKVLHTKDNFCFQCRYCLILDSDKVPEGLE